MVRQTRPAVVRITTDSGSGSGAIFDTQGQTAYIITNHHVIEDASRVTVTVNDSDHYTATILGSDSTRDLAVIRICCGQFRKLDFGNASNLYFRPLLGELLHRRPPPAEGVQRPGGYACASFYMFDRRLRAPRPKQIFHHLSSA